MPKNSLPITINTAMAADSKEMHEAIKKMVAKMSATMVATAKVKTPSGGHVIPKSMREPPFGTVVRKWGNEAVVGMVVSRNEIVLLRTNGGHLKIGNWDNWFAEPET